MQISELYKKLSVNAYGTDSWDDWQQQRRRVFSEHHQGVDRAFILGAWSRLPAFAFASGYQAALAVLYPQADLKKCYAFCVTEAKGNSPGAIETTLTAVDQGWRLQGEKAFITAIDQADELLVAAQLADAASGSSENPRKQIKLVRVPKHTAGLELKTLPQLPFVSELSHGAMVMNDVVVADAQVFPGDGYVDYVKRFRSIEDVHVSVALVGFWLGLALRFQWPESTRENLMSLWLQYRALSEFDFSDAGTHVALAGMLTAQARCIDALTPLLDGLPEPLTQICLRDRKLERVAGTAREKRLSNAWQSLQRD